MIGARGSSPSAGLPGEAYGFFRERGLSPYAAAGILGNIQQESSFNPYDSGGGLFQDIGSRAPSGTGDARHQLESAWRELEGMPGTLAALRRAGSAQEAARIFSEQFERPGTPMLGNRERYAAEMLQRFAHMSPQQLGRLGGGVSSSEQVSSRFEPEVPGLSGAQIADLMQLMGAGQRQEVASLPPRFQSVDSLSVRTPQSIEGPSTAALLSVISKIGEDAQEPGGTRIIERDRTNTFGEPGGAGHEVAPTPGFVLGRTDMGVDATAKPGTPIRAIGNGRVLGISPDWYAGQPYLYYEVLNEHGKPVPTAAFPDAGKIVYVAEQIDPKVKPGDLLRAGQTIATYAGSGTGIEEGFGTKGWQTQAQAEGRTGDAMHNNAPAGARFRELLARLGER